MLALKLYVKGQQVDLFKDESVTLTQSIQDVRNIDKVFTDFSRTFTVPASKANNKIFKHFYNYHIDGFDAREKHGAELYLNDELFKKGKIKLEGATTKSNKAHTYKLTFFGSTVNLKDLLGEDKLGALTFLDNFKFDYTDTNVKAYMSDGLDVSVNGVDYKDALIFPLITHTRRLIYDSTSSGSQIVNTDKLNNIVYSSGSTNLGLQISELKPAFRAYVIIKAIEDQYGITFSDDFFSTTNEAFYDLYLWLHHKTGGLFVDEESSAQFGNFVKDAGKDNIITLKPNNFQTPPVNDDDDAARFLDFTLEPSSTDLFNVIIKKDGQVYQRFDSQQRDSSTNLYAKKGIELEAGNYTFEVECTAAVTFGFKGFVRRKNSKNKTVHWTGTASTIVGNTINTADKLPDIKVIDFVTGLFKMFNLTAFQNDRGILEVKTLDSFYESSSRVWDITKDIDKTEQSVDGVLPFKQVNFDYEGTDSFLAKNHFERYHTKWGSLNYTPDTKSKIEGSVYTIKLPFEHFMFERLYDENTSVTTPTDIQYGWSADIKQEPTLGKPLLFYPVKQTLSIGIIDSAGNLTPKTTAYVPSNSRLLTNSKTLNFGLESNEFAASETNNLPFEKSLFNEYYKTYITEIFDKARRLTKTKAYLPLNITKNMTLADRFRISDNLYKINKIVTNFENNQSSLELINTNNTSGDLIIVDTVVKPKYDNTFKCITADTDIYTADNIILKADFACGDLSDGKILSNPKDNQSDDLLLPNSPDPLNSINDVIVTAPTVKRISNDITGSSIKFTYEVSTLGLIDSSPNLAEYGFLIASDLTLLAGTDVDVIKATAGVEVIEYLTNAFTNRPSLPHLAYATKDNLTANTDYYYRFYARTNLNTTYAKADTLSELETVNITTYCQGDFYRYIGFQVGDKATVFTYLTVDGVKSSSVGIYAQGSFSECICLESITSTEPFEFFDPYNNQEKCT
jgi:hypothetical protein